VAAHVDFGMVRGVPNDLTHRVGTPWGRAPDPDGDGRGGGGRERAAGGLPGQPHGHGSPGGVGGVVWIRCSLENDSGVDKPTGGTDKTGFEAHNIPKPQRQHRTES